MMKLSPPQLCILQKQKHKHPITGNSMKLIGSDIEMKPITNGSSVIEIGVDEFRQHLKIKFNAGSIYLYKDVSLMVLVEIMKTEKPEQIVHRQILGQYEYIRVKKAPSKWIMSKDKKLKGGLK